MHGFASAGAVAGRAFLLLFIFQYTWVFLGNSCFTSLFASLQAILNRPSHILDMLSSGLAGMRPRALNKCR